MTVAVAIGGEMKWPAEGRRIFFSTQTYELAKRLGAEAAGREFDRMVQSPQRSDPPVARMVYRTRQLGTIALYHGAGTQLAKLRSRAAHAAFASGAETWLMCDDDVECDTGTLLRMFHLAGSGDEPLIVVLPCLLRGLGIELRTVNVEYDGALIETRGGEVYRKVIHGGTGLMIVNRAALRVMYGHLLSSLDWIDEDSVRKCALFEMEREHSGRWFGEDLSFCRRARRAGVAIIAPAQGVSVHDGHQLQLEQIP